MGGKNDFSGGGRGNEFRPPARPDPGAGPGPADLLGQRRGLAAVRRPRPRLPCHGRIWPLRIAHGPRAAGLAGLGRGPRSREPPPPPRPHAPSAPSRVGPGRAGPGRALGRAVSQDGPGPVPGRASWGGEWTRLSVYLRMASTQSKPHVTTRSDPSGIGIGSCRHVPDPPPTTTTPQRQA